MRRKSGPIWVKVLVFCALIFTAVAPGGRKLSERELQDLGPRAELPAKRARLAVDIYQGGAENSIGRPTFEKDCRPGIAAL